MEFQRGVEPIQTWCERLDSIWITLAQLENRQKTVVLNYEWGVDQKAKEERQLHYFLKLLT